MEIRYQQDRLAASIAAAKIAKHPQAKAAHLQMASNYRLILEEAAGIRHKILERGERRVQRPVAPSRAGRG